jgi:hypothetical protein
MKSLLHLVMIHLSIVFEIVWPSSHLDELITHN